MADSIVQEEEIDSLKDRERPSGITWHFDYEKEKQRNTAEILKSAIKVLPENEPSDDYYSLIDLLKKVAKSSNGIDIDEAKVIYKVEQCVKKVFNKHD